MSFSYRHFAAATLAVIGLGLQAGAARAADPFYLNLLREGSSARGRGDLETAIEDLRLACFGLLDEPTLLAGGLVELALAQAGTGDGEAMSATVHRLLQVERLFGGYSRANLSAEVRQQFEELLYRRVEPARLDGLEAFRPLTERRQMEALESAAPDRRRALLAERLTAEPSNAQWLRMLADLELGQARPGAALPHLSALLDQDPDDSALRCERFRAATAVGRCDIALEDLAACPSEAADAGVAQPILDCYTAAGSWRQAADFLATLPPPVRSTSKIRKLERQIDKELRKLPAEPRTTDTQVAQQAPPTDAGEGEVPDTTEAPEVTRTPGDAEARDPEPAIIEPTPELEIAPEPDPCDPFRAAARAGLCDQALAELSACQQAAAEREIAPAIMKCHTEAASWADALAFAESLPPQVRGLPKIRKLQRRATKQADKEARAAERAAAESQAVEEEVPGDEPATDSPAVAEDPTGGEPSSEESPTTPPQTPSPAELAEARRLVDSASTSAEITQAYAITSKLALDYPTHQEAQLLAAQGAYRAAQWDKAVGFFEAAGTPGDDQPLLQFYYAVALFETGQPRRAADLLERALPRIRRTPFVDSYVNRIYAAAGRR